MASSKVRVAAIAALTGVILGITGTAALATNYSSWQHIYNFGTNDIQNRSFAGQVSGLPYGGGQVLADVARPAGYLGQQATLYKGGGVCATATAVYTSVASNAISRSAKVNCGSGNYTGYGLSWVYTGSQNYGFPTYTSPNYTYP